MSTISKPSAIHSDAFGTLFVRVVGIVLIFASTTVTARILGPGEYGMYSAAMSLSLLLATIAPLGSDRLLVRNLSVVKCPGEAGQEAAIAHLCTACVTLIVLCASLGSWFVNAFLLDNQQWAQISLLASILFVPLTATYLRTWLAIPLIGTRRAVMPQQTILPFIFTITMLLVAAIGWKLTAITTSTTYAGIMLVVWIGSLWTRPLRSVLRNAWTAIPDSNPQAVTRQFRNGLPFVSVAIGSVLTQSCMPLLIAAACGLHSTAYYSIAMPFAALAAIPLGVFNLTLIPRCARCYKNGDFVEANHVVRSAATATFCLAAGISFVIWQCSPLLVRVLGEEYSTVCRLFPLLLLAALVDCLTGPTIPVMQTMRMEKTHSMALFSFIPIQFGLVYWLGSTSGIEGAAIAYFTSRCLWNAAVSIRIYQLRGLIMLPYLSFRQAFREMPPVQGSDAKHRPQHDIRRTVPTTTNIPLIPPKVA